jgi:hypothetical protein
VEVGLDAAGLEIDDADTKGGELDALVVGEHGGGDLGGVIDARERGGDDGGDGGIVDDDALGLEEQRQEGLRDGDVGPDVEVEESFGFGEVDVGDGHVVAAAGVVDEHVEPVRGRGSEGSDLFNTRFDRSVRENVESESVDAEIERRSHFGGVARCGEDAVAAPVEGDGEAGTKTAV